MTIVLVRKEALWRVNKVKGGEMIGGGKEREWGKVAYPIVDSWKGLKVFVTKRRTRDDFPTPGGGKVR
jgi:hypothetical protein